MTNTANRSFRWLFWTLAIVGLCLDQGSKYGVFAWLSHVPVSPNINKHGDQEVEVVADVFYFAVNYSRGTKPDDDWRRPFQTISNEKLPEVNHGALWGIGGKDETGADFNHIFAIVSIAAAVAIVIWSFRKATAHDRWLCMALGLILAGTLGNLYDRVIFHGVRDFLQWVYKYDWPRFNVADSCLVCGAGLLLIQAFFTPPVEEKKTPETASAGVDAKAATADALQQSAVAEAK
ncbi:MAG TPA: signal peptidase II [Gemmataceae bacterium]|nr:signal peptidase II [Gemmataceae bacterium]